MAGLPAHAISFVYTWLQYRLLYGFHRFRSILSKKFAELSGRRGAFGKHYQFGTQTSAEFLWPLR
jgi:hypothetical protein